MRGEKRFDRGVLIAVGWIALSVAALGIYNKLRPVHWPTPIQVSRNGKVETYSWDGFLLIVATAAGAFWLALRTNVGEKLGPVDLGYSLRRSAKITGWIIAVGATLGALHLLLILLGKMSP